MSEALAVRAVHPDHRSPAFGSPGREPVDLVWRDTWPEDGPCDDYVAIDNGVTVARVIYAKGAHWSPNVWQWACQWLERREDGADWAPRGSCESRRQAMLVVEGAYNRWRAVREIVPAGKWQYAAAASQ